MTQNDQHIHKMTVMTVTLTISQHKMTKMTVTMTTSHHKMTMSCHFLATSNQSLVGLSHWLAAFGTVHWTECTGPRAQLSTSSAVVQDKLGENAMLGGLSH